MENIVQPAWYREPWVWFILGLLGVAMVSASVMSVVAVQHTPAEIGSHWYQEGILAKREKQQEGWVKQIHLQGELSVLKAGQVILTVQHDALKADTENIKKVDSESLVLYIEHPVNPDLDQTIVLKNIGSNQYSGQLTVDVSGKRRLLISPPDDLWFLTSEAYFPVASNIRFLPN